MSTPYAPYEQARQASAERQMPTLIKGAIWIAIGSLIAAAIVCVVWVLVGDQNGLIGKAFLTVLLLAGFAGVALLDANLAQRRPDWLVLASMVSWVLALLIGAVKIWLSESPGGYYHYEFERFFELVFAVGVMQLALLHLRLFWSAQRRHVTTFTRVVAIVTTFFVVALAGMLLFYLTFPRTVDYDDLYWRIVVATAILAAVGTTLLPLFNALFAPKRPRPVAHAYAQQAPALAAAPVAQPWPTYVDGFTPLPAMPDGSPDWNAYYTGYPTYPQAAWQQHAPSSPQGQFTAPGSGGSDAPQGVPGSDASGPGPDGSASSPPPAPHVPTPPTEAPAPSTDADPAPSADASREAVAEPAPEGDAGEAAPRASADAPDVPAEEQAEVTPEDGVGVIGASSNPGASSDLPADPALPAIDDEDIPPRPPLPPVPPVL